MFLGLPQSKGTLGTIPNTAPKSTNSDNRPYFEPVSCCIIVNGLGSRFEGRNHDDAWMCGRIGELVGLVGDAARYSQ